MKTLAERFWAKVRKTETCWLWEGYCMRGYGRLSVTTKGKVKTYIAARLAYELTYGTLPENVVIRHTCDNPPCVRPDHLLCGTQDDNVQDAVERKRMAYGERQGSSKLTEAQVISIRSEYVIGVTMRDLGEKYQVSHDTIFNIVKGKTWRHLLSDEELKVVKSASFNCGERASDHKLTEAQVFSIRAEYAIGSTIAELARKYQITNTSISRVVKGRTWKHLLPNDEGPPTL